MIKIILNIIGVIICLVFSLGGLILIGHCAVSALEELMIINETIAINIYGIICGWIIFVIGDRSVIYLIRD